MFKKLAFATALTLASLYCSSEVVDARASAENREKFPDIEYAFANWGNNVYWSSHEVVTADGYVLTLFNIKGRSKKKRFENHGTKGPILLLHGFSASAMTWFSRNDES